MHNFTGEKSAHPAQDEITLPFGNILSPPPLEDRRFYVPADVEAYSQPLVDRLGVSSDEGDGSIAVVSGYSLEDQARQHLLLTKEKLGGVALKYINEITSDDYSGSYDKEYVYDALPYISPPTLKREIALGVLEKNDASKRGKSMATLVLSNVIETNISSMIDNYPDTSGLKKSALYSNSRDEKIYPPEFVKTIQKAWAKAGRRPLTSSILHDKASKDSIVRIPKTGTETYILPDKYEASVRVIPIRAAVAWMTAQENPEDWRKRGFNYIPIEPIDDIAPAENSDMVAVTTTNLRGRSLYAFIQRHPEFEERLKTIAEEIILGISERFVRHGHFHKYNFVVVPYTHDNGRPDLTLCPRVYAIDFDNSSITVKDFQSHEA